MLHLQAFKGHQAETAQALGLPPSKDELCSPAERFKSSDLEFGSSGLLQFEPIVRVDLQ